MHRLLAVVLVVAACSGDGPLVRPTLGGGAADGVDDVTFRGTLALGTPVDGAFTANGQFDGYYLDVRAGAEVKLEITHGGSSMKLDTTLFVFGPERAGGYPDDELAFDDNAGYGKLSKLTTTLSEEGRYAVVVGTHDGKGRGRYRLVPTCLSGDCAPLGGLPLGACPAPVLAAMRTCVDGNVGPYEPLVPHMNAAEQCADADVLAPVYDAECAAGGFCEATFEAFYDRYAAACTRDVKNAILDGWCVFGVTYRDIAAQPSMTLLADRQLTATSTLGAIERDQIISALHASAHTDVTTVAEAFARVDDNVINQRQWWDASARRAYTSYEYGAGDNSYGRIFAFGTATQAADITDGDIYPERCTATYGAELRDCSSTIDCRPGTACTGINADLHRGSCIDEAADTSSLEGSTCTSNASCTFDAGLACAGLSRAPSGVCLPAWQRRAFVVEPALAIPDNTAAGETAHVHVYGLAAADTDVWLHVQITHPRTSDLVITLENPAGRVVPVFSSTTAGTDLDLDIAVTGLPGGDPVNGHWQLHVADKRSGNTGTVDRVTLTLGSR
ncbi:MAG TPA: proprotein convertase P-domain-containing protein [Kofleriaceae bacterium]|nr:proprotein convertase P-domain-containing protein [Kofleriaceae bacterium]